MSTTRSNRTTDNKAIKKELKKANVEIRSFQDLVDKAIAEKEIELKYDLERNVKLIRFEQGKIDINFNEKLNKNFIKQLSKSLLIWTNRRCK